MTACCQRCLLLPWLCCLLHAALHAVQHDSVLCMHPVFCFLEHYTSRTLYDCVCTLQSSLCRQAVHEGTLRPSYPHHVLIHLQGTRQHTANAVRQLAQLQAVACYGGPSAGLSADKTQDIFKESAGRCAGHPPCASYCCYWSNRPSCTPHTTNTLYQASYKMTPTW